MWRFTCMALLVAFALAGCHTNKNMSKTENMVETTNYTLPKDISVSTSFRMLWDAWKDEVAQSGKPAEQYTPSAQLIKRFSLRNQNGEYLVTGFLQTTPGFTTESRTQLGGHCVKYNDTTYSFGMPLRSLASFVNLPGIVYIEASSPVQPR